MNVVFRQLSWTCVVGAAAMLLLLGGGSRLVYGQEVDDTTQAVPRPEAGGAPSAPLDSVRAEDVSAPDTSAPETAIVTADSLSAMVRDGKRLQELFNDVKVRQDTTRLRSDYGLRYLNRDELLFTGDVVIYERGDTLRADTVWYNKRTKVGRARSNVRLTDGEVVVRAPRATYYTEEKRSVFPDSVTLVDSNRVLRAQRGIYWSNDRRAEFSGNVQLADSNTYLEADSLTYFRDTERSIATGSVFIRRVETKSKKAAGASTVSEDTTMVPADTASIASDTTAQTAAPSPAPTDTVSAAADTASAGADAASAAADAASAGADATSAAPDTTSITYLFGEWVDNQEQNRYSRVERQALLVRVRMDSTGAPDDTLAVRAHRLEAKRTDTYRRLVAVDSVRIWQADLAAVADSVVYDRIVGVGPPDTAAAPAPLPDTTTGSPVDTTKTYDSRLDSLVARAELVGVERPKRPKTSEPETASAPEEADTTQRRPLPDTPRTVAASDSGRTPGPTRKRPPRARPSADAAPTADTSRATGAPARTPWQRPVVQSKDNLPLEEMRLFRSPVVWFERAQVWGDSIRVRARNRSLDTVYVRGAAFAAQKDTTVDRIRQLKGKNITAYFRRDSLRQIRARPNGRAIYFSASEKGKLNGATRASADYVDLFFRGGSVQRIKFGRGVQGTAYHKKKFIPDPFRLDGFQWTPDRRPTRASILREKRVRERLGLDSLRRAPKDRRPPVARAPADSVRRRSPQRDEDAASRSVRRALPKPAREGEREPRSPPLDSLDAPADSLRARPEPRPPAPPSDTSTSPNVNP